MKDMGLIFLLALFSCFMFVSCSKISMVHEVEDVGVKTKTSTININSFPEKNMVIMFGQNISNGLNLVGTTKKTKDGDKVVMSKFKNNYRLNLSNYSTTFSIYKSMSPKYYMNFNFDISSIEEDPYSSGELGLGWINVGQYASSILKISVGLQDAFVNLKKTIYKEVEPEFLIQSYRDSIGEEKINDHSFYPNYSIGLDISLNYWISPFVSLGYFSFLVEGKNGASLSGLDLGFGLSNRIKDKYLILTGYSLSRYFLDFDEFPYQYFFQVGYVL